MTKGRLIRGLGLATGLLLACAGSAQAGTHGDIVTFKQAYPLKNVTRVAVQGQPTGLAATKKGLRPANCRLPRASLSLAPRERAIELREVALNLRTCRATFERGVPPRSADGSPSKTPKTGGSADRGSGATAGVQAQATGYQWGGYSRAWYKDARTGRVVTEVKDGADWNARGGCIGTNNVWYRTFADTTTGWGQLSRTFSYVNNRCDYVSASVDAHFRDQNFSGCSSGPQVDEYYKGVKFIGYPNGGIKASRTSWNDPSCKDVLIAYFALYRK